ncbi:MAG: triose-phosphate isomerase [Bacteroidetes bacterium]|jgi:triosephosphate isomerase|nr:triose-phosphate isomerase [Bacteroidota bacterium]MCA6443272.1 triose-phosphate isomerase [Bacteroidota bacterium]
MRKKIIAGNWKMNLSLNEANELHEAIEKLNSSDNQLVKIIFPPFVYLDRFIQKKGHFNVGAQNVSQFSNGAYTGEISANMLKSIGCQYVLIGHSERREYFNEGDNILSLKVKQALQNSLKIIYCIGETKDQRQNDDFLSILSNQLNLLTESLEINDFENISIAYEPVWAIGTGLTASPDQVEEVHASLRIALEKMTNKTTALNTSIIYGGSCNTTNAESLFSCPNVDGGLIGGASLKAKDFLEIIALLNNS